jgi:hypothetical protein
MQRVEQQQQQQQQTYMLSTDTAAGSLSVAQGWGSRIRPNPLFYKLSACIKCCCILARHLQSISRMNGFVYEAGLLQFAMLHCWLAGLRSSDLQDQQP